MNPAHLQDNRAVYYRLIALWVIAEGVLGGIIHALKLPVSGLLVGGWAVVCISLIGWYNPGRGHILKATLVVAVFKMMLSPQAPPAAYFAVFFQGIFGEWLCRYRMHYRIMCVILAVLSLTESGFQRILMLTLVYGKEGWQVLNDFINQWWPAHPVNYSGWLIGIYLTVHVLTGIILGWWMGGLPRRIESWQQQLLPLPVSSVTVLPSLDKRRRLVKGGLWAIWAVLLAVYIMSVTGWMFADLGRSRIGKLLLRSGLILLAWYLVIAPVVQWLMRRWLERKRFYLKNEIGEVVALLPSVKKITAGAWQQSSDRRGWRRFVLFARLVLAHSLYIKHRIWILSAPKGSGKTTALQIWCKAHPYARGVLTPVINGKRYFHNLENGEQTPMEAEEEEKDVEEVGRFRFSAKAFKKVNQLLQSLHSYKGYVIIDEVGPLELKGGGFYPVIKNWLKEQPPEQTLVLVVREGLASEVAALLKATDVKVINQMEGLQAGYQGLHLFVNPAL